MRGIVPILTAVILIWASSAMGQSQIIKITQSQAQCLAENIHIYESYATDPVIIVLDACPRQPSNNQLADRLAQRNAGPGLLMPKMGSGENILILLRSQLACVEKMVTDERVQTNEAGFIEISLDDCSE